MKFALALIAALATTGVSTPSSAQVISTTQVLSDCPDVLQAEACPALAIAFLGNQGPSPRRDQQIVNLVVAIAEAAQQTNVSRQACLNAADGLRVLASGVSSPEQSTQISDIADALCAGHRTASIGRQGAGDGNSGFSFSVPESLSEQSSGGGGAPVVVASSAPADNTQTETTEPDKPKEMPPQAACQSPPCNVVKPDKPPKP